MVLRCRKRGLKADVADMETFDFGEKLWDGIWAYASLLHIPKEKSQALILKIARGLTEGGIFGLSFKEGKGNEYRINDEKYPGTRRWFTYYADEEIRAMVLPYFSLLEFQRVAVGEKSEHIFLDYALKVKPYCDNRVFE